MHAILAILATLAASATVVVLASCALVHFLDEPKPKSK